MDQTLTDSPDASRARLALAKVPEITIAFWVLKLLTTGMGEAMSDFMGQKSVPIAGAVGVFGLGLALYLQLRSDKYHAPYYWFVVMMVAIFGTMGADAIHDGLSIGYQVTTPLFAIATAAVFWYWHRTEGTLSIHSITTRRRELLYWLTVLCTFALGTAAGDLTALALNLGFGHSIILFAAIMLVPALAWWRLGLNPIIGFWAAYILTRPLGASFADWFSKHGNSGLGLGDGTVSGVALIIFLALVAWVTISKIDVQPPHELTPHAHHRGGQRARVPRLSAETD